MAVVYAEQGDDATRSPTRTSIRNRTMTPSPRKNGAFHMQPTTPRYNMITERARRLRAQYNLQAQSLRTRVEIRLNRIPMSLQKLTMAELVKRHVQQQERSAQIAAKIAAGMTKSTAAPVARPGMKAVPSLAAPTQTTRRFKRTSNAMLGGDKENDNGSSDPMEYPKKRARAVPANASENGPVLSPTSSNSRLVPRSWQQSPTKTSPIKVPVSRAASPVKTSRANLLSNMVEKAKTTRAAMTRKATTASVTSTVSSTASTTASSRTKRKAASKQAAAPATRITRRTSGDSNSSSSTVVKKTSSRPGTAMSKSSTTSRGKAASGTATKKTAASKASAPKDAPRRVLRSRAA
ncbi:hypothetical protein Cpir12675_004045 [Ceratocystis pirilliformis]|uniref:Borealin N-terminal domain-containing protein n=1 Tax=Ceratocystis pirilliformis TaxID=259994 RepID=A0ABR3YZX8_9PEZI